MAFKGHPNQTIAFDMTQICQYVTSPHTEIMKYLVLF